MCNYSVKQQNPGSASFLAALCFGPREIRLPGELREPVPGRARGARHGGKLMDLISRAGLVFFMTFSLHLSVDSCDDIDDYFRGSSTSWLGGSLLVGGQRTGLCVWVCLPGRLEAIQKWNGARFRCLQPKHFQSRINNTTFQLFTMNNKQLSVFKQFSKNNTNAGRASKLFCSSTNVELTWEILLQNAF